MRRVLLVSPHFPPASAADMHRVRLLAPLLDAHGWSAEVLSVRPADTGAAMDACMVDPGFESRVHRVVAPGTRMARVPGFGTLGVRSLPAMARAGDRLLRGGGFDLVYFSTTMFELHLLGPRWRRRFGVPFAMDYQDAWVSDYYRERPGVRPPGGRLKYALASAMHRWMEPRVLARCGGITSVSPDYPLQLRARYPLPADLPVLVQPFPASPRDFSRIGHAPARRLPWDPGDGCIHWVYVGRGGEDMARSVGALFEAIALHAPPALRARLRLHFIGTSYAAGDGTQTIAPLARRHGLDDIVREQTGRVPYSTALACLRAADALVVPGSDDPAYTASKIYPYLLAGKPLLAVFHRNSSVSTLLRRAGGGTLVEFDGDDSHDALVARIAASWLSPAEVAPYVPLRATEFEPYTDARCAQQLAAFFDDVVATGAQR